MARQPRAVEPGDMRETADEVEGEVMPPRQRQTTAVATRERPQFSFGQEADQFEVAEYIAVPMLEIPPGQTFVAQFIDKVRILKPIEGYKSKYKGDHWASTIRAQNGEARLFTWNTVFKTEMEKNFPPDGENADGYVGEWFRITRLPIKSGKDYATFSIIRLRLREAA